MGGLIMTKKFFETSKDYILYLLKTEPDGAGLYREAENIIRIEAEYYTYHICNWGVMTAERNDGYKPYEPHKSYKCSHSAFNALYNTLDYRMNVGRAIDITELV